MHGLYEVVHGARGCPTGNGVIRPKVRYTRHTLGPGFLGIGDGTLAYCFGDYERGWRWCKGRVEWIGIGVDDDGELTYTV